MKKVGAFTDLEINERAQRMELEVARIAQEQAAANLRSIMDIEGDAADRDTDRHIRGKKADTDNSIALKKADTDSRTAQLMAGAKMSPEQILAINAGISPEVAEVLKEQARAKATAGEDSMQVMKELIKSASEERESGRKHELDILKAGMTGATGVAHGAGGKAFVGGGMESTGSDTIECPECGRVLPAKANFCTGCGHKMRT